MTRPMVSDESDEGPSAYRIRIYSDRSFLPSGVPHAAMLDPFWGPSGRDPETRESFRRYRAAGHAFFE
ncbi:MAG: hypothetical protein ACRD3V_08170, partial [Vicinamibacteria bacterium]